MGKKYIQMGEVKLKKIRKNFYILPIFLCIMNSVYAEQGNFAENIFSNDYIFTILLIVALASAVLEILTPGFGLGGVISIVAFVIFFWGNISLGNTNYFEILLFILGLLLIGFEIMIPGFGVCGIGGIIVISYAIVMAMDDVYFALFSLAIALVISIVSGFILLKKGANSEIINRLRLLNKSTSDRDYVGVKSEEVKVGDILKTNTILRPTGYAHNKDKKIEVISDVGFIGKDEDVVVVKVSGARVYVKKFN